MDGAAFHLSNVSLNNKYLKNLKPVLVVNDWYVPNKILNLFGLI